MKNEMITTQNSRRVAHRICKQLLVRSVRLHRAVVDFTIDELLSAIDTARADSNDLMYNVRHITTTGDCSLRLTALR